LIPNLVQKLVINIDPLFEKLNNHEISGITSLIT